MRRRLLVLSLWIWAAPLAADPADEVRAVEQAFADSMAKRDFEAFKTFLAEDTIFFNGDTPLRGKAAVAQTWSAYFQGETAPFAWVPEHVAVLDSGALALSSGPVTRPDGERVATFTSIWRRDADGHWRIVFDKGSRYCPPPPADP